MNNGDAPRQRDVRYANVDMQIYAAKNTFLQRQAQMQQANAGPAALIEEIKQFINHVVHLLGQFRE